MEQVKSRRDRTEKVAQTLKKEKTEPNQNVEVGFPIKFVVSLSFKDLSVCKKFALRKKVGAASLDRGVNTPNLTQWLSFILDVKCH